jgi:hypothetical protein
MKQLILCIFCALLFISCLSNPPYQFDNFALYPVSAKKPLKEAGEILSELGYPTKSVNYEMGELKTGWHKFVIDKGALSIPLNMRTQVVINARDDGSLKLSFSAQSTYGTVSSEKNYQPIPPNMEDEVNDSKAEYKRVREALSKKFSIKVVPHRL